MKTHILLCALANAFLPQEGRTIRVVKSPHFTKEVMAKNSVIAGKELKLIERNEQGDCLCIGKYEEGGEFMVDVDYRDVEGQS